MFNLFLKRTIFLSWLCPINLKAIIWHFLTVEDFSYQHLNNTLIKYESILIRFGSWVEEHLNWALHCTFYKRCDWKEERTENNMLKMDSHQNCILHVQLTDIWLFMNKTKQLSYNWCHCVFQTPLVAETEMEVDDSQQGTGNDPSRNRQLWVQGLAWPKHWKDQVQVLDRESQTHIFKSASFVSPFLWAPSNGFYLRALKNHLVFLNPVEGA